MATCMDRYEDLLALKLAPVRVVVMLERQFLWMLQLKSMSEEEGLHLVEANQGIAFVHSQMLVDGFEKMFHVHCLDIEEGCISEPLALICKARNGKKSLQRLLEELDMRKMNSLIR